MHVRNTLYSARAGVSWRPHGPPGYQEPEADLAHLERKKGLWAPTRVANSRAEPAMGTGCSYELLTPAAAHIDRSGASADSSGVFVPRFLRENPMAAGGVVKVRVPG